MPGDYTNQLNAIVAALNRPAVPTWLVALISVPVGALLTFGFQVLLRAYVDRRDIRQFRQILYRDISGLFTAVAMDFTSEKQARQTLENELQFQGEDYLKKEQRIYMRLSERFPANEIYASLHGVLAADGSVRARAYGAAVCIARCIYDGKLKPEDFLKFVNKSEAEAVLSKARAIFDNYSEQVNRMNRTETNADSGNGV